MKANQVNLAEVSTTQRRKLLKTGAVVAGGLMLGLPGLAGAAGQPIKIGHLTPMTGFLGALGEYASQGIKMAAEEINANGGLLGRPLELISEDSVNPQTAATKAQRMIEQNKVDVLMGEINSASALTISQVAARSKKLFLSIGARSDSLRNKNCNRYTFHVDIPVTVMVNAAGEALVRQGLVKGKKIYALTSDYIFGHDLSKAAKNFFTRNGGTVVGDDLVATDLTDFSPQLLKIRQAKPDLVATNLGGNQVTNFVKQYSEFGLTIPVAGFNLNTADAWAAGDGNLGGWWPTVWHHELKTPGSLAFVARYRAKYGRTPENHAWIEYISLKMLAQAITATKSVDTEKLIKYFESEAKFDILKGRPAYFRSWDHQLMQEAYPFTVKGKGESRVDKNDFLVFGDAVPGANEPLDKLAPPRSESTCKM
jgi:branched-chain amino acid transport system substrate-binding protein